MLYSLLVCAAPDHPAAHTALLATRAVLARGHQLHRLFFYRDAVHLAHASATGHYDWKTLIEQYRLDAVICVSAAASRGLNVKDPVAPWEVSGLGQWAEALHQSDRVLRFG